MSRNARIGLAIAGIAVLIAAAAVLSGGSGDESAAPEVGASQPAGEAPTGPTAATGATGGATSGGGSGGAHGGAQGGGATSDGSGGGASPADDSSGGAKAGAVATPLLVAGQVAKITVVKGQAVRLRARSAKADELHIHGYDLKVGLPAGETVAYSFKATIAGVFEIEFKNQALRVASLRVDP